LSTESAARAASELELSAVSRKFDSLQTEHEALKGTVAELQKRAALVPRLQKAVMDLRTEHAAIGQKLAAKMTQEEEIAALLQRLLPSLPPFSKDLFADYVKRFLGGFPRLIVRRTLASFTSVARQITSAVDRLAVRSASFNKKVAALTARHRPVAAALAVLTGSYSRSLAMLFPAAQKITIKVPPDVLHARIGKIQALLQSIFALLPLSNCHIPADIYGLSLGLRRIFESETIPDSLGDLARDIDASEIKLSPIEERPGLVRSLLAQGEEMVRMLNGSMPLVSIVETLARELAIDPAPPATDDGLVELLGILRRRIDATAGVSANFRKYAEGVQALLQGISKSLPATLDPLLEQLRHPVIPD
jgi:hypothetical protein